MAKKNRRTRAGSGPGDVPAEVLRVARDRMLRTPFLVMDTRVVADCYRRFREAMPDVRIYYAVKANPADEVLRTLVELGSRFDIASPRELFACLQAGAKPRHLSYANTTKKPRDIADAAAVGVHKFAVDTPAEVDKVAANAPGAGIFVRLDTPHQGSAWPLGTKFGTEVDEARRLLERGARAGLDPLGVSFHAGSQQHNPHAYVEGLRLCARVVEACARRGMELRLVDIGGGFPARGYARSAPDIEEFAHSINEAVANLFDGRKVRIAAEPGRYLVADAGWMVAEVIGDAERVLRPGTRRWVTIDAGVYQGFAEAAEAIIEFDIRPADANTRKQSPAVVAGPTCDSIDVFHSTNPVTLPRLTPGDRVIIGSAGAYTSVTAAVGFNGFDPPSVICLAG